MLFNSTCLQVYDIKTGRMVADLGDVDDEHKEFTFVRLTFDGLYVVWIDKVSIKAKRVSDGQLVAHISTHERPTSLVTLDYGYILVVGRDDGRLLVMKLVVNPSDADDSSQFVFRPGTALDRTQALLDRPTCDQLTLTTLDQASVGGSVHEVRDADMTHASDHIRSVLLHRAKMPLVMTAAITGSDKYRRCFSTAPLSADFQKVIGSPGGSPFTPMTSGSDIRPSLVMIDGHPNGRSGSSPCLELSGGSTGELNDIDRTPDSTPPLTGTGLSSDSPPLLVVINDGTVQPALFDKRISRSLTNMASYTLPTRGKCLDNKHRHRHGLFNNTPRHRKPLPAAMSDSPRDSGVVADLPPRPSTAGGHTVGRRGFFNMILDLPATIRQKRRKSKQRAQSNSTENRDRMPSV